MVLQKCLEQYNSDLNTEEWIPVIENNENKKAHIKQFSKNEVKFIFEIKLPGVDFQNMWKCFISPLRLKLD